LIPCQKGKGGSPAFEVIEEVKTLKDAMKALSEEESEEMCLGVYFDMCGTTLQKAPVEKKPKARKRKRG
jgi:hypothetical protein